MDGILFEEIDSLSASQKLLLSRFVDAPGSVARNAGAVFCSLRAARSFVESLDAAVLVFFVLVESLIGVELSFLDRAHSVESSCSVSHRTFCSLYPLFPQQVGSVFLVERSENVEELLIVEQVILVSVVRIKQLEYILLVNALYLNVTFDQCRELFFRDKIGVAGVCDDE